VVHAWRGLHALSIRTHEYNGTPVSFALDWAWWLFPLPVRSSDLNLVSPPDHHYHHHHQHHHHHHHHTLPVLLCKIKISSIYYVRELQPHFIKSCSCNRRPYLSSQVIYDIYAHFLFHYERVRLSSTQTCLRWRGNRQSSRTCNLQETTNTDGSAGIGEKP
jgi:hypothetical protein